MISKGQALRIFDLDSVGGSKNQFGERADNVIRNTHGQRKDHEPRLEGTSCQACPWRWPDSDAPKAEDLKTTSGSAWGCRRRCCHQSSVQRESDRQTLAFWTGVRLHPFPHQNVFWTAVLEDREKCKTVSKLFVISALVLPSAVLLRSFSSFTFVQVIGRPGFRSAVPF